jgi:hypothetical protein
MNNKRKMKKKKKKKALKINDGEKTASSTKTVGKTG